MSMRILFVAFHFAEVAITISSAIPRGDIHLVLGHQNSKRELTSVPASRCMLISVAGPKRPLRFLWAVAKYAAAYLFWRPQVVHFQEVASDLTQACWAISAYSKRVLTVHDVDTHPGRDAKLPPRKLAARDRMRRTADMIIVHGECLKDDLLKKSRMNPQRVAVIPHVALRRTVPRHTRDGARLAVLFFGRMEQYKGLDVLVEAMELECTRDWLTLRVAGEGPELARMRSRLGVLPNVEISEGRVPAGEIDALIGQSDVVVLPYTEASQSGVVAMAFGIGRPVVASRIGAIPEVVTSRVNGLLVPPNNPRELRNALLTLARDRDLLDRVSIGASETAARLISPAAVGSATAAVYDQAAGIR